MTAMDMRSLLTSLEAIKRVCTYEKGKLESSKKLSHKSKKGKKHPGTDSMVRVPKKVRFENHCNLCKKHGGAYTTHNTRDCRRFEKDGNVKSDFRAAKKGGQKGNLVNHNFAQLTDKIEKLEKALKKSGKKGRKRRFMRIVIPTPNRVLGWVALRKQLNLEKPLRTRVILPLV